MRSSHQIEPVKLPTDQGQSIDAWAIVGTAITYAGQEGEARAREHAARLDAEAQIPRWEAVPDADGQMWRVRWSEAGPGGEHLYVRHYPGSAWGKHAAEGEAKEFNQQGRSPHEWDCYKPRDSSNHSST